MCWEGMSAAEAARVGFGVCLLVGAALLTGAVLVIEAVRAWSCPEEDRGQRTADGGQKPAAGREDLKLEGDELNETCREG